MFPSMNGPVYRIPDGDTLAMTASEIRPPCGAMGPIFLLSANMFITLDFCCPLGSANWNTWCKFGCLWLHSWIKFDNNHLRIGTNTLWHHVGCDRGDLAAEPAAGSAGSIGIFGKIAEGGDTVKETGRSPGRHSVRVFAAWTNSEALLFSSEDQSAENMLTVSACIIKHWHDAAIAEHRRFVNSAIICSGRARPETSETPWQAPMALKP